MIKPILFNTEMVKAILEGRKTQTRRVIKTTHGGSLEIHDDPGGRAVLCEKKESLCHGLKPPFEPGDILWVRETWCKDAGRYMYRANYVDDEKFYRDGKEVQLRWSPSIHMPKEAARIFLRVKAVKIERLRHISFDDCKHEGIWDDYKTTSQVYHDSLARAAYPNCFAELWNSTIKPADRDRYSWEANPWVWVIEFERCERPEGWH